MPKIVDQKTRDAIVELVKEKNQSEVAKICGVSRMFVNSLVNNRPIRVTRLCKQKCPITGMRY